MRTRDEIISEIEELFWCEFKKRLKALEERAPNKCKYHYNHQIDFRKEIQGSQNLDYNRMQPVRLPIVSQPVIGLCLYGASDVSAWEGNFCDTIEDAIHCPMYALPVDAKDKVISELVDICKDIDRVKIELPHIYYLFWVLKEEYLGYELPWWRRLLVYLWVVKPKPYIEFDISSLVVRRLGDGSAGS